MKITDLSPENRPRERLERQGAPALSNAELLAIILKSGTRKENVLEISHKLLSKYGLGKLSACTLTELMTEYGIGKAKACQILALFELYKRLGLQSQEKVTIACAADVARIFLPRLKDLPKEQFVAVYLDTKNRIIGEETITIGILNASLIHPREVFHGAIKNLANSLIVVHNHPSGDSTPSSEDLEITRQLQQTGEVIGIKLLDHLIIGRNSWWSWKEKGIRD